jgi:hypothetical protein
VRSHYGYSTSLIYPNRAFGKPQQKFLLTLLPTILLLCGKVNFTNLSRYSELSERTYRRQYGQSCPFPQLNASVIAVAIPATEAKIGVMDCSFIPKSGKGTAGLDWFYNGSASRSEKGLEISVFAVVNVAARQGYALSVQQTPAQTLAQRARSRQSTQSGRRKDQTTPVEATLIAPMKAVLQQLPPKPPAEATRVDHYLTHLRQTQPALPEDLKYLVVDGWYAKVKFVEGVVSLNLAVISKLRHDANMRYLYIGEQKARGAKRKYGDKVDANDLSRFTPVPTQGLTLNLYTLVVWHVSLKRHIRLVCLVNSQKPHPTRSVWLFSTDLDLDAEHMVEYYQARFQIEFIFRDAKQFTGLADAQTRNPKKLDFHFNASLLALNLAKYEVQQHPSKSPAPSQPTPFSMASYKRLALNDHLLSRFISMLDLDPTLIKSHPNYPNLRDYGRIAP